MAKIEIRKIKGTNHVNLFLNGERLVTAKSIELRFDATGLATAKIELYPTEFELDKDIEYDVTEEVGDSDKKPLIPGRFPAASGKGIKYGKD